MKKWSWDWSRVLKLYWGLYEWAQIIWIMFHFIKKAHVHLNLCFKAPQIFDITPKKLHSGTKSMSSGRFAKNAAFSSMGICFTRTWNCSFIEVLRQANIPAMFRHPFQLCNCFHKDQGINCFGSGWEGPAITSDAEDQKLRTELTPSQHSMFSVCGSVYCDKKQNIPNSYHPGVAERLKLAQLMWLVRVKIAKNPPPPPTHPPSTIIQT